MKHRPRISTEGEGVCTNETFKCIKVQNFEYTKLRTDLVLINSPPQLLLINLFVFNIHHFLLTKLKVINNVIRCYLIYYYIILRSTEKSILSIHLVLKKSHNQL